MQGFKDFDPVKDIPDMVGKVILVTGGTFVVISSASAFAHFVIGTSGLGAGSVRAFAAHGPLHIYFTGRNVSAANNLISEIRADYPKAALSFLEMDLSSLSSVKNSISKGFKHSRLDVLMCNAGIVAKPPSLSTDGYEIQFATNHLGHAMLTKQLLPHLLAAAEQPGSDVRVVVLSSDGYESHRMIKGGISFQELDRSGTMSRMILGGWIRYGQSKLANILFASELARRYPNITSVAVHPGVVMTPMNAEMDTWNKTFVTVSTWLGGIPKLQPEQGVLSQLWAASGAKKEDLRNGGFYRPVGVDSWENLTAEAKDAKLAGRLWEWTENVLSKY